ncbi:MAG: PAS domain S-box protein [Nitrospiraceae bacterium]|nr:MAG: PAS domain S-box protein [Nitrospiraceae bacterium]UCH44908.1 MAG: PAS domain S-box protein [Nitrospiraceae bacterium]
MINRSIKSRLVLAFMSLVFVAIAIGGAAGFYIITTSISDSYKQELQFQAEHFSTDLESFLRKQQEKLMRIADSEEFTSYQRYRNIPLALLLMNYSNTFPVLSFIDKDGYEEIKVVGGRKEDDLIQHDMSGFLQEAISSPNKVVISSFMDSPELSEKVMTLALSKQSYFGNTFLGILTGQIPAGSLSKYLSTLAGLNSTVLVLIDKNGTVIAHSKEQHIGEKVIATPDGIAEIMNSGQTLVRDTFLGVDSLSIYTQLHNRDWYLVASLPYAIMSRIYVQLFYVFIILAILILGVSLLIAIRLARSIGDPIIAISSSARRVARGDMSARAVVTTKDEVGDLADTFNEMVDKVGTSQKKLEVEKTYIEKIIKNMTNCLIVLDDVMNIIDANEATCKTLGYTMSELLSEPLSMLFAKTGTLPDKGMLAQDGLLVGLETRLRKQSGEEICMLGSYSVMDDDQGVMRTIVILQDITEIKMAQDILIQSHNELEEKVKERTEEIARTNDMLEAEILVRNRAEQDLIDYSERLERNNAELQEFAYVASHDLQEPLRKILTFGDRLKSKFGDSIDEQGRDYLERMQNAARRMKNLINGLLSFSRIRTRAVPFEQVDLKKAAESVIEDLEVSIEQSGGRVEISEMATIDGDPLQIQQVLQNLIGNALKFSKEDAAPEIKVHGHFKAQNGSLEQEGDGREYYEIVVEDNGIGFDEKYSDRIFGVFQRLHGKAQYEGTGIGLSICRKIAERHRGKISAHSTPGEGSSFIVTLPVTQEDTNPV